MCSKWIYEYRYEQLVKYSFFLCQKGSAGILLGLEVCIPQDTVPQSFGFNFFSSHYPCAVWRTAHLWCSPPKNMYWFLKHFICTFRTSFSSKDCSPFLFKENVSGKIIQQLATWRFPIWQAAAAMCRRSNRFFRSFRNVTNPKT